jgi:hypothetical protein
LRRSFAALHFGRYWHFASFRGSAAIGRFGVKSRHQKIFEHGVGNRSPRGAARNVELSTGVRIKIRDFGVEPSEIVP